MLMLVPPQNWTGYDQGAYLFLPSYVMRTHGVKQQREIVKRTPMNQLEPVFEGNWTWEHAKLKARIQTLQRNLGYPPMASNFRYIQDKKCDEDDYILTYQDKGEWLIAGDIPWHCWFQLDEANISITGV
ncbi:hypothetical protein ES332_A06G194500v1 [Gossypium tomentosum]|nr:hypothetical protein ES332_A06G194500v1 [Gossypium tomentosum]